MRVLLFASIFVSLLSVPVRAQVVHRGVSEGMRYVVRKHAAGLGVVWGLDFLPGGDIIFTERSGKIGILREGIKWPVYLKGVPKVYARGQGGLMDIRLHPDYRTNGWVYLTYAKKVRGGATTVLARARIKDRRLVDLEELLVAKGKTKRKIHFGSRIAFDGKGHVFFTVGERGKRPNAQNLMTHTGSVLRLNEDGSVPEDNPFVGREDALPEIWSYGHRNPQGLVYDAATGRLWSMEHGPRGGDEINLTRPGRNYGWPVITYGKEYWGPVSIGEGTKKKGMEQPVKYYTPSIAPCGLELYSGKLFPKWKGNLFSGALKRGHLNRVVLKGTKSVKEERLLGEFKERMRSVRESPDGRLWVSTDQGNIYTLSPN